MSLLFVAAERAERRDGFFEFLSALRSGLQQGIKIEIGESTIRDPRGKQLAEAIRGKLAEGAKFLVDDAVRGFEEDRGVDAAKE